ncbi:PilX N-terminal domain-containing pilus assembly protein [uncultured Thiohalocapsa sp.]|uniref:pilus assembly PilX family protein n=1 Tax=uncultured Thiohalocapsa sp. TaxID=768990 RepID=UPI0025FFBF00|nr:PilX N-terminal domain-containing pilus assembly protein [uncultured Thiohalocapsa sp.]
MTATARHAYHAPRGHRCRALRHQRGAILIFGLVILLAVTLIGVGAQRTTVLQERLAGNMRQNNIALQAAEAGLQVGLTYVEEQDAPIVPADDGAAYVWTACSVAAAETLTDGASTDHPCQRRAAVIEHWRRPLSELQAGGDDFGVAYPELTSMLPNAPQSDAAVAIPGVIMQPRIYIEALEEHTSPDTQANSFGQSVTYYYTVISVGFGGNAQARALLQSTIVKHFPQ